MLAGVAPLDVYVRFYITDTDARQVVEGTDGVRRAQPSDLVKVIPR